MGRISVLLGSVVLMLAVSGSIASAAKPGRVRAQVGHQGLALLKSFRQARTPASRLRATASSALARSRSTGT